MHKPCRLYRPGTVPYETAWRFQEQLAAEVADGAPPALVLLEHPHIFTLGRRGRQEHLLWDQAELDRRGVQVFHVDRGGDITYHGPGQLVGYPILNLAPPGWQAQAAELGLAAPGYIPQADFVGHIRSLEKVLILALQRLGLDTEARPGLSGVWIPAGRTASSRAASRRPVQYDRQPGKIASIGVKVDVHGISRHGFALNVDPDMEYWNGIIACGLEGVQMVSLADFFDPPPGMDAVAREVEAAFGEIYNLSLSLVESTGLPGAA